ncbi:MAG: hypothetical protein U5J64_06805 [Halobacteriales archaeon]|nr:hypothetical protein [Halobacteriales archaeon]
MEFLFALGLIYLGGILMAQALKILPLFLAMSEVMRFHRTFPVESYLRLRTLLKMAPYRLLTSSVDYTIHQLLSEGLAAFVGSLIGMAVFWVIFGIGILQGLFYFRLRHLLFLPVRFVINLN